MVSYFVTGANRGLGLEFVNHLSKASDNVVFALVRNKDKATKLQQLGRSNIHILQADIIDYKALKVAAQEVAEITGGSLDVLINNAAALEAERVGLTLSTYPEGQEELLESDMQRLFHINVIGVIHTINVFLPLIRKSAVKKVITITSGVGDIAFTLQSGLSISAPYSISKAALHLALAKYAAEFKAEGVLFLSLSPGLVNTAEALPPPEQLEIFKQMVTSFQKVKPSLTGPMTPEHSVNLLLDIIDRTTIIDTGAVWSHNGNSHDWL